MRCDRCFNRVKFNHHGALIDAGLIGFHRHAADDEFAATSGDSRPGQRRISRQLVGIIDFLVGADPIGLAHSICSCLVRL